MATMLVPILTIVRRGHRIVAATGAPDVRPAAAACGPDDSQRDTIAALSGQELAVLHRLPFGWSNKQIARYLTIAEATVKVHLRAIFRKIDVLNRTSAAIWSARHLGEATPPARAGRTSNPVPLKRVSASPQWLRTR